MRSCFWVNLNLAGVCLALNRLPTEAAQTAQYETRLLNKLQREKDRNCSVMLSQLKRVTNGIYRDFSNIAVCPM